MLINFFYHLKGSGLSVTIREFLDLLESLKQQVIFASLDDFYYLSRTCLIKDEKLETVSSILTIESLIIST